MTAAIASMLMLVGCGLKERSGSVAHEVPPPQDAAVIATGNQAFQTSLPYLDEQRIDEVNKGRVLFRTNFGVTRANPEGQGLGPLFSAPACMGCHPLAARGLMPLYDKDGKQRGEPLALLFRLSITGADGNEQPHPVYGSVMSFRANHGSKPEARIKIGYEPIDGQYADGEKFELRRPRYEFYELNYGPLGESTLFSPRLGQQVAGLGLLEAIPQRALLLQADAGGGRPNWVVDPFTGKRSIGRFGWKAGNASLEHQTASAFKSDMGMTSRHFPQDDCTILQTACIEHRRSRSAKTEVSDDQIRQISAFLRSLAPPAQRDPDAPEVRRGEAVFMEAGCAECHRPEWRTAVGGVALEVSNKRIRPFTDLLLHDMGEGLADNRREGDASGREWRTAPLWGIGLLPAVSRQSNYLHDGRARNISEAILWHGGKAAASKEKFRALSKGRRDDILYFLYSL